MEFVISLCVVVNLRVSSNLSVEVGKSLGLFFRDVILGAISLGSTLVVVLDRSDIPALFFRRVFVSEVEALESSVGFFVRQRTIDIQVLAADRVVPFFINGPHIFVGVEVVVIVAVSGDTAEVSVMVRSTEIASDVFSILS